MDQIIQYGEVQRGRVGVEVADFTNAIATELTSRSEAGA